MWIGNVFINTIGKALPYINGFVMAIKELIKMFAIFVGYKAETPKLVDPLGKAESSVGGISSGLGKASKHAKELKKTLMGFDVLNVITTPKEPKGGSGGGGVPSIDPKILGALKEYDSIMESVRMKATKIRDKIMDWLGFTKKINPFTGEISWKLREGFTWLKAIKGIIKALVGLFLITRLIKLVGWLKTIIGVFKGTTVATTSFQKGISLLGQKLFITTQGVGKHAKAIKTLNPLFVKLGLTIAGVTASIKGLSKTFEVFNNASKGITTSNKELTKSVLATVGGFTALGGALGGPIGAVFGALAGILAQLTATIIGTNKAFKELARSQLFGDLTISTEQFTEMLANSNKELSDYARTTAEFKVKIEELGKEFQTSAQGLELFITKSSLGFEKLTNEDIVKFKNELEGVGKNSLKIIEEDTNHALTLFSSSFKKSGDVIDEGEQQMLNDIIAYGEKQKTTISEAQGDMVKTYEKAIQTRGYLTENERKFIEEQLQKIREVTKESMSVGETDMEYYATRSSEYSKETYENFKKASDEYLKNVKETAGERYNEQVNWANKMYGQNEEDQDKLNEAIKKATDERTRTENEASDKIEENQKRLLRNMADRYIELEGKTDKTSKNMRKEIENTFKDYNIDASDIVTYSNYDLQSKGKDMGRILGQGAKSSFKSWFNIGKLHFGKDEGGGVKFKWYANGGMPEMGEMFVAREAGPELVGKIGNRTAVLNNSQIVEAVSQGVAQAVGQVMGKQQGGNVQVFVGDEQITDIITRRKNINANVMGY